MKRKIFFLSIFLLSVFLLNSCVDYVQTLTYQNGKYHYYLKLTFSKILMEMVGEDVDEFMQEFDEEVISSAPSFVSIKPVNTDIELGAEFAFSIDPRDGTEEQKSILPKKSGNKYFIPFLFAEELSELGDSPSSGSESDEIAMAFFSTAKCRILISKKIIPEFSVAFFEGRGGENFAIPAFDYGESFCLEIPFIVFFESYKYNFDKIVLM